MRYAFLVALREFAEHTKTKGFWIGILLFPVLLAAGFQVPRLLEKYAKPTRNFVVIDPSGSLTGVIDAAIETDYQKKNGVAMLQWTEQHKGEAESPAYEPIKRLYRRVELPADLAGTSLEETKANLRPFLKGERDWELDGQPEELFALIVLPDHENKLKKGVEFWCTNLADTGLSDIVESAFTEHLKSREYESKGIDRKELERIVRIQVELERLDPKKAPGEEEVSQAEKIRQWAPIGFVYMLFVAIMTVAQMLLGSTIEEKSNRIVEVLLSSVTPWELMLGKLLGVAFVGIAMLLAWLVSIMAVLSYFSGAGQETAGILMGLLVAPGLIVPFAAYFVLGYLMYSSILLGIGSTCTTLKDAQNFMGPVMTLLMVPLFTMFFIVQDPNGTLATVLSWIPIFTPFVMMNRMAGDPPTAQIAGTFVVLTISVAFSIWFSGRIFQNGILRTGQPPKFLELLKLVRKA